MSVQKKLDVVRRKGIRAPGTLVSGGRGHVIIRKVVRCPWSVVRCPWSVVRPFTMLYHIMGKPQFFCMPAKPTWDEFSLEESDEVGK